MDDRTLPLTFYRDGITRLDATRRLLALADGRANPYQPTLWLRRAWALLCVLGASLVPERRA